MPSVFGWLDGDENQRRQMLEIVKLFQDEGSVDELGIGTVRDTFANALFPATSVLHTRARYLLFIPWLIRDVAQHGWPVERSRSELRKREGRLIHALLAGNEHAGVIGNQMKERLKTMPSALYWASLGRMRLRTWDVSIDGHFRAVVQRNRQTIESSSDDDISSSAEHGIHASLPPMPPDLLDQTDFELRPEEASFLRDRLAAMDGATLYGWLAVNGRTADPQYVWLHPQISELDPGTQAVVDHARRLHHLSYGAPLLYNLMLAELSDNDELTDEYRSAMGDWEQELGDAAPFDDWSPQEFWGTVRTHNPRISLPTEAFLTRWFRLTEEGDHCSDRARALVRERELRLKGNRSRLVNPEARSQWSGRAGLVRLDYRWRIASSHLRDIYRGVDA
jgi:hypothetical protein